MLHTWCSSTAAVIDAPAETLPSTNYVDPPRESGLGEGDSRGGHVNDRYADAPDSPGVPRSTTAVTSMTCSRCSVSDEARKRAI